MSGRASLAGVLSALLFANSALCQPTELGGGDEGLPPDDELEAQEAKKPRTSAIAVPLKRSAYGNGRFVLHFENDAFAVPGTDAYYSNGLRLDWMFRDNSWVPAFLTWVGLARPAYSEVGLALGQHIYTPADIEVPRPGQDNAEQILSQDRPYGGWAYLAAIGFAQYDEALGDSDWTTVDLQLDIGCIGSCSAAAEVQTHWHAMLRDLKGGASRPPEPQGWDIPGAQVDSALASNLLVRVETGLYSLRPEQEELLQGVRLRRARRLRSSASEDVRKSAEAIVVQEEATSRGMSAQSWWLDRFGSVWRVDVSGLSQVSLGTVFNNLSLGSTIRAGLVPPVAADQKILQRGAGSESESEAVARVNTEWEVSDIATPGYTRLALFVYGRAVGRAVAYNALLRADLTDDDLSTTRFVGELSLGATIGVGRIQLSFDQTWRTTEVSPEPAGRGALHGVGRFAFTVLY